MPGIGARGHRIHESSSCRETGPRCPHALDMGHTLRSRDIRRGVEEHQAFTPAILESPASPDTASMGPGSVRIPREA